MNATFQLGSGYHMSVNMIDAVACGIPIRNAPEYQKTTLFPPTSSASTLSITSNPCCSNDSVSAFYLSPATVSPVQIGSWTGSIEAGSSVNCNNIHLCPHGAGTHTECLGHVVPYGPTILEMGPQQLLPGIMLMVQPEILNKSHIEAGDTSASSKEGDFAVTASGIHTQIRILVDKLEKMGIPVDPVDDIASSSTRSSSSTSSSPPNSPSSSSSASSSYSSSSSTTTCVCTCGSCEYINRYIACFSQRTLSILRLLGQSVALRTLTPQAYLLSEKLRQERSDLSRNTGVSKGDEAVETDGENLLHAAFSALHKSHNEVTYPSALSTSPTSWPSSSLSTMPSASFSPTSNLHGHVHYSGTNPPYLTVAAALYLRHVFHNTNHQHILIDLPSADRENDDGKVQSHWVLLHQQQLSELDVIFEKREISSVDNCDDNDRSKKNVVESRHAMPLSHWEKKGYCLGWVKNFEKSHNPNSEANVSSPAIGRRSITELCWFPENSNTSLGIPEFGMWDIRIMAVESDAGPSMPIFYRGVLHTEMETALE